MAVSDDGIRSTSAVSSKAFADIATKVGPVGAVLASWNALRMTEGTCSACVISVLHLAYGRAISARSERPGAILRMSLFPAVITIGVPP